MIDRHPPSSPEAEAAVLGCCFLDPQKAIPACVEKFAGEQAFYDLRHQSIFNAMLAIDQAGGTVDLVTVYETLKNLDLVEKIGGAYRIGELPSKAASPAQVSEYAQIVLDHFVRRKLIRACFEISESAYDHQGSLESMLSEAERAILAVRPKRRSVLATIKELVQKAITEIEETFIKGGKISGVSTGLIDLDKYTDGLHPAEVTVLAGFPGSGKSSLAMNIAEHAMLVEKRSVGVFSLEMSAVQLVKRTLCSHARVNLKNVRDGFLTERDFPKLTNSSGKIAAAAIYFDDTSDLSIYELRARARRMHQEHVLELIVVDYLQLLNASGGARRVENRQQEVSDISGGLKQMSKELNVPVLALSQLNDDGQLRESRAIGMDADSVWKLHKPAADEDCDSNAYPMDLFISKQRNGPRDVTVHLTFLAEYTRFESAAKVSDDDIPDQRRPTND